MGASAPPSEMEKPQHMNCVVSESFASVSIFKFSPLCRKKKREVVAVTNASDPSYREFSKYEEVLGVYLTSTEII